MLGFHMRVKSHQQLAFKRHKSETVYYYNSRKIFTRKINISHKFQNSFHRFYVKSMIIDIFRG